MDNRERIGDDEETLRMAFDSNLANVWTALPCIVSSVDFTAMTVSAQPAIKGSVTNPDGSTRSVNLPLLVDVPLVFPTAGGFSITFPVASGDECLVVFASRCIDGWWQSGGVQEPMEFRMHDLSDGFAIIGTRSQARKLSGWDETKLQIRSDDGATFVELSNTAIKLKATTVAIESTTLTHNGKNIGDTHTHSGVTSGTSNTGVPV